MPSVLKQNAVLMKVVIPLDVVIFGPFIAFLLHSSLLSLESERVVRNPFSRHGSESSQDDIVSAKLLQAASLVGTVV